MKIILDKNVCIGCGACAAICPRYFEMGKDGKSSVKKLTFKEIDCIKEAADSCPVKAISINK